MNAIWLLPALLVPLALSAPIRHVTQLSMPLALASATALCAALALWMKTPRLALVDRDRPRARVLGASLLALELVLFFSLYNFAFRGMINTQVGVDTGTHTGLFFDFIRDTPDVYKGFVAFYGLMYFDWLFSASAFHALRFAFYAWALTVPFAFAGGLAAAMDEREPAAAARGGAIATALFGVPILFGFVFPLLSYHQSDGFFSHLFGFFPVLLLLLTHTLVAERRQRAIITALLVVLERYTYPANFAEIVVTSMVMWWPDVRSSRWWKAGFVVAALAGLGASAMVLQQLWDLRAMDGFFTEYKYGWVLPVQLVLALVFLLARDLLRMLGMTASAAALRFLRYGGTFSLANGILQALYLSSGEPIKYYYLKYGLYAVLLLAPCLFTLLAVVTVNLVERGGVRRFAAEPGMRRAGCWSMAILASLLLALWHAFGDYHEPAWQRALGGPYTKIYAFYDGDAEERIERVLAKENKKLGGFFSMFWPRAYFHNISHGKLTEGGYLDRAYRWWNVANLFKEEAGQCYFWQGTPSVYSQIPLPQAAQVTRLGKRANVTCEQYPVRWDPGAKTMLCWTCM
jgi:hypothetical protein